MLLLNLGGPDSIAAVRPFLLNLFSDRSIIKLPLQPLTSKIIAWSRARKVVERYRAIGGSSPILKLTRDQAQKLQERLKEEGYDCRAYVGMTYWHPFIREAIEQIEKDGYEQVVVVSLFPQFSAATTGACLAELRSVLERHPGLRSVVVQSWHDDAGYLDALADCVREGLAGLEGDKTVLFSAHGLPQDFIDRGDPYADHLEATIKGVMDRIDEVDWRLAFQSRSGPVKWLDPQTEDVLKELGEGGAKNVLIVPVSFVSDHIETLYEVDILYRELAEQCGIENFVRSQSLNSKASFINALAGITQQGIGDVRARRGREK